MWWSFEDDLYLVVCKSDLYQTVSMVFSSRSRGRNLPSWAVEFNGICLNCVDSHKYLGVYVVKNHSLSLCVATVVSKAKCRLAVLGRASPILPDTFLTLY